MATSVTTPAGRTLHLRARRSTTRRDDIAVKPVPIKPTKADRLAENREYLKDKNVSAFLKAVADAEGGGYDFKYGAVKGKKNDPWRFTDFSTHPGPGWGGSTTASGMYQVTKPTWAQMAGAMGLSDFSPTTQDLIAVEILRTEEAIDDVQAGNINAAVGKLARRWAALPQGKGLPGKYPKQPWVSYETFVKKYTQYGGTVK